MSLPEVAGGMSGKLVKDSIDKMAESLALLCRCVSVSEVCVPEPALRKLMTIAVRLYAAASERAERELVPVDSSVSTTEAVIAAVALLRSQNLTAFEAAIWFARLPPQEWPSPKEQPS
jgi:hypothetical protein